ncbi:uroporphyrinogen-III synthase [soil metagenome]
MRPVLILRPEPGASATAARALAMGLTVVVRPLFETRAMAWTAPPAAGFDALLLTSANAVRLGGADLSAYRHLPVFAVGEASAEAARQAGFATVIAGQSDAAATIAAAEAAGCRKMLHLAGRDRIDLGDTPFRVETIVVYASDLVVAPQTPENTVALLHSVRAARRFAEVTEHKSRTAIVTISRKVADAAGPGWQSVTTADEPQDAAMLALAAGLCEKQAE